MTVEPKTASVRLYAIVFGALALLTGLTVLLSYLHLPHRVAIPLAALIAFTKCTLIASVFMHLKWEGKAIRALLFTGLFFVAVLVLAILPDIGIVRP